MSTTLKLSDDLRGRVAALAEAQHRSAHGLMLEMIAEYVDRAEKRQAFLRDAQESWREYKETGLHITGDEAIAWLETWGTDNEKEAPACHL